MFAKAEDLERSRKFGEAVQRGSFTTRIFTLYIPVWLFSLIFLMIILKNTNILGNYYIVNIINSFMPDSFLNDNGVKDAMFNFISLIYFSFLALLIPVLKEKSVRKWRRKNGFSIYKSIEDDFQRMEVEKRLKREQEAKMNLGIDEESGAVDKSDIRYWHGLLKDGIIDQAEFDKKKSELI